MNFGVSLRENKGKCGFEQEWEVFCGMLVFANSLADDVHPQVANVSHALKPESVALNEASRVSILMV